MRWIPTQDAPRPIARARGEADPSCRSQADGPDRGARLPKVSSGRIHVSRVCHPLEPVAFRLVGTEGDG